MKNFGIIYKIINNINGKVYIGQTTKPLHKRWTEHLYTNPTRKYILHKAMVKYGRENFTIEELAQAFNEEELDQLEVKFIKENNSLQPNGYNIELGGNKNKKLHPLQKAKIKDSNIGWKCKQPNSRSVTCIDLKTGIEKSYKNMGMAVMDGFGRGAILRCIKGKEYSHNGFRWKNVDAVEYPEFKAKRTTKGEKITGLTAAKKTLESILNNPEDLIIGVSITSFKVFRFPNIKEVYSAGYDYRHIIKSIKKGSQHKGVVWAKPSVKK